LFHSSEAPLRLLSTVLDVARWPLFNLFGRFFGVLIPISHSFLTADPTTCLPYFVCGDLPALLVAGRPCPPPKLFRSSLHVLLLERVFTLHPPLPFSYPPARILPSSPPEFPSCNFSTVEFGRPQLSVRTQLPPPPSPGSPALVSFPLLSAVHLYSLRSFSNVMSSVSRIEYSLPFPFYPFFSPPPPFLFPHSPPLPFPPHPFGVNLKFCFPSSSVLHVPHFNPPLLSSLVFFFESCGPFSASKLIPRHPGS